MKNIRSLQVCTKSVMDTTDPDIVFDENGICNHYYRYKNLVNSRVFKGEEAESKLSQLVDKIKSHGKGKEYDCIIGVSGGVDSTYVAYITKKLGLRPLAVHFDNGWNSELAVSNIEKTLNKLGIDLYTYVIDWEEFKDLQLAFLKASTPDGEIPTDHAINALLFQEAAKRNIKYIISGMNFETESMSVKSWAYGHSDWTYIKDVYNKFGSKKEINNYPHFTLAQLFYYTFIKQIKVVSILNYLEYNKKKAMDILQNELGWIYYGGKHYESVYTRFYQGYILPRKFCIDKRKAHLSDLIFAGQITREEALEELQLDPLPEQLVKNDKEFLCKKLELTPEQFEDLMNAPIKSYKDYKNIEKKITKLKELVNYLRLKGLYTK